MVKEHTDKTNTKANEDEITNFRPDVFSFWTALVNRVKDHCKQQRKKEHKLWCVTHNQLKTPAQLAKLWKKYWKNKYKYKLCIFLNVQK